MRTWEAEERGTGGRKAGRPSPGKVGQEGNRKGRVLPRKGRLFWSHGKERKAQKGGKNFTSR